MQKKYKWLSSQTVLFVDDESTVRESMHYTLGALFKKVYVASNGIEALEIFQNQTVDLIITDLEMPHVDGVAFIEEVRNIAPFKPVIVFSAYTDQKYLLDCCNLSIQAYVVKPITREKFDQAITNAFAYLEQNQQEERICFANGRCYNEALSCIEIPNQESYSLKKKEKQLLELLLHHRNKVVSYSLIEETVWVEHWEVMSSLALRTVIKNLRKAIGKEHIQNFSGQGYMLEL